jgi:hypothetical protein
MDNFGEIKSAFLRKVNLGLSRHTGTRPNPQKALE